MNPNKEKLRACFSQSLGIPLERVTDGLTYNTIPEWDSVGHMTVIAGLETEFGLMLETDDILDMSTVGKAVEILTRYGVAFDAA